MNHKMGKRSILKNVVCVYVCIYENVCKSSFLPFLLAALRKSNSFSLLTIKQQLYSFSMELSAIIRPFEGTSDSPAL